MSSSKYLHVIEQSSTTKLQYVIKVIKETPNFFVTSDSLLLKGLSKTELKKKMIHWDKENLYRKNEVINNFTESFKIVKIYSSLEIIPESVLNKVMVIS